MDIEALLIVGIIFLLISIFFLLNFKWCIIEFRNISREVSGYIKLGQLIFLFISAGIFLILFIYYIIKPSQVSNLDVFLTIVVGFLGTMLGYFFKESTI